jgi:hypothetical protein
MSAVSERRRKAASERRTTAVEDRPLALAKCIIRARPRSVAGINAAARSVKTAAATDSPMWSTANSHNTTVGAIEGQMCTSPPSPSVGQVKKAAPRNPSRTAIPPASSSVASPRPRSLDASVATALAPAAERRDACRATAKPAMAAGLNRRTALTHRRTVAVLARESAAGACLDATVVRYAPRATVMIAATGIALAPATEAKSASEPSIAGGGGGKGGDIGGG